MARGSLISLPPFLLEQTASVFQDLDAERGTVSLAEGPSNINHPLKIDRGGSSFNHLIATGFYGLLFADIFNEEVINLREPKILILSLNIILVLAFVVRPQECSHVSYSLNEHIC